MKKIEGSEIMPFPPYETLVGVLNTLSMFLSGILSEELEPTDEILEEIKEVLEFCMTVDHMSKQERFSEFLKNDNKRFKDGMREFCDDAGVDYEEARQIIKAKTEIGERKFDIALDKATKK